MPFPLAHSLAGATLQTGLAHDPARGRRLRLLAAVVLANAPDLDFVPGLLIGDPNRFHHGWTHSLLVALVAGALVALAGRALGARGLLGLSPATAGLLVAALLGSHVFLDLLTEDARLPLGIPALWPISARHFHLGAVFARAERLAGPGSPLEFVGSLLTVQTAQALLRELLIVGPVLGLVMALRRRRPRSTAGS